jgi:hypothetical protein
MPDSDPLDQLLEQVDPDALLAERRRHLEAIAEHQRRIDTIDHLLALKGSPQKTDAEKGGGTGLSLAQIEELMRPSLAQSILDLMETAEEWNADLLLGHLTSLERAPQGKTPKNSVAATLSRLRAEGKVRRVRPGFYSLARPGQDAKPAATGDAQQQRLVEGAG